MLLKKKIKTMAPIKKRNSFWKLFLIILESEPIISFCILISNKDERNTGIIANPANSTKIDKIDKIKIKNKYIFSDLFRIPRIFDIFFTIF